VWQTSLAHNDEDDGGAEERDRSVSKGGAYARVPDEEGPTEASTKTGGSKKDILFVFDSLFWIGQVQTLLVVLEAVLSQQVMRWCCTGCALLLSAHFARRRPCTIPAVNRGAAAAFFVTVWLGCWCIIASDRPGAQLPSCAMLAGSVGGLVIFMQIDFTFSWREVFNRAVSGRHLRVADNDDEASAGDTKLKSSKSQQQLTTETRAQLERKIECRAMWVRALILCTALLGVFVPLYLTAASDKVHAIVCGVAVCMSSFVMIVSFTVMVSYSRARDLFGTLWGQYRRSVENANRDLEAIWQDVKFMFHWRSAMQHLCLAAAFWSRFAREACISVCQWFFVIPPSNEEEPKPEGLAKRRKYAHYPLKPQMYLNTEGSVVFHWRPVEGAVAYQVRTASPLNYRESWGKPDWTDHDWLPPTGLRPEHSIGGQHDDAVPQAHIKHSDDMMRAVDECFRESVFSEGDSVEARCQGSEQYYPGKICKQNPDDGTGVTYSVKFNDALEPYTGRWRSNKSFCRVAVRARCNRDPRAGVDENSDDTFSIIGPGNIELRAEGADGGTITMGHDGAEGHGISTQLGSGTAVRVRCSGGTGAGAKFPVAYCNGALLPLTSDTLYYTAAKTLASGEVDEHRFTLHTAAASSNINMISFASDLGGGQSLGISTQLDDSDWSRAEFGRTQCPQDELRPVIHMTSPSVPRNVCMLFSLLSNCFAMYAIISDRMTGLGGSVWRGRIMFAVLAVDLALLLVTTCVQWAAMVEKDEVEELARKRAGSVESRSRSESQRDRGDSTEQRSRRRGETAHEEPAGAAGVQDEGAATVPATRPSATELRGRSAQENDTLQPEPGTGGGRGPSRSRKMRNEHNVLSSFQFQVDSEREERRKQNPLKMRDYFSPFSNFLLIFSFWFFWAQITAVSFVPDIQCWTREGDNATSSSETGNSTAANGPQVLSAVIAEDVCSWLGDTWRYLGRLLLFTIDMDFSFLPLISWPEFNVSVYQFQFWVSVSVAVLFPPLTREYHKFFKAFRRLQDELNVVMSKQRTALEELTRQNDTTDREKEAASAIENQMAEATRVHQAASGAESSASLDEKTAVARIKTKKHKEKSLEDDLKRRKVADKRYREDLYKQQGDVHSLLKQAHAQIVEDSEGDLSRATQKSGMWDKNRDQLWVTVQAKHSELLEIVDKYANKMLADARTAKEQKRATFDGLTTKVAALDAQLTAIDKSLGDVKQQHKAALSAATAATKGAKARLDETITPYEDATRKLMAADQAFREQQSALSKAKAAVSELVELPPVGSSAWLTRVSQAVANNDTKFIRLAFTRPTEQALTLEELLLKTKVTAVTTGFSLVGMGNKKTKYHFGELDDGTPGPMVPVLLVSRKDGHTAVDLAKANRKRGAEAAFAELQKAASAPGRPDYSTVAGSYESQLKVRGEAEQSAQQEHSKADEAAKAERALANVAKATKEAAEKEWRGKDTVERNLWLGSPSAALEQQRVDVENALWSSSNQAEEARKQSEFADRNLDAHSYKYQPVVDATTAVRKRWAESRGAVDDGDVGMSIFKGVASNTLQSLEYQAYAYLQPPHQRGLGLYKAKDTLDWIKVYLDGHTDLDYPADHGFWAAKKNAIASKAALEKTTAKHTQLAAEAGKAGVLDADGGSRTLAGLLAEEDGLLKVHGATYGRDYGRAKGSDGSSVVNERDGRGMDAFDPKGAMPKFLHGLLKSYLVITSTSKYDKHGPQIVRSSQRHDAVYMWNSAENLSSKVSTTQRFLRDNDKATRKVAEDLAFTKDELGDATEDHGAKKRLWEEKEKAAGAAKIAMNALETQQKQAAVRAQDSENKAENLGKNVFDQKELVKEAQEGLKKRSIDKRRCGNMYKFFDTFTAVLYMNVMRTLAKALACTGYGTGAQEYLIALPGEPCFVDWHQVVAPLALLGMLCLYPSAVLTRPLFQALDPKLNLRFNYNYLFVFAQIQTALLLASAFYPNSPMFLLSVCLAADVALCWYFKFHEPCTSTPLNTCAYR
jgi:hypothetical protein